VTVRQKGENRRKNRTLKVNRQREKTDFCLVPVSLAVLDLLGSTGPLVIQVRAGSKWTWI